MPREVPEYRAYCDICNGGSAWFVLSEADAQTWREMHFADQHPENPMLKENCRIQRRMIDVEDAVDNPAVQARMVEALNND